MSELCISCNSSLSGRRHVVTCDVCGRKQHRLCDTGITQDQYRRGDVKFVCQPCVERIPPRDNDGVEVGDEATEAFLEEAVIADEEVITEAPNFTLEVPSLENSSTNSTEDFVEAEMRDDFESSYQSEADVTINYSEDQMDGDDVSSNFNASQVGVRREAASISRTSLDATFDLAHRNTNNEPDVTEESFNVEPEMPEEAAADRPVDFKILEKGSKRGGRLLVSSDGFSYNLKTVGKKVTLWRCSVRSKKMACHASVSQIRDTFTRGSHQHIHTGDQKKPLKAEISAKVKETAKGQVFRPAMNIVEGTILDNVNDENRFLKPKELLLKRAANRYRAKMRPTEPEDLDFELNQDFLQCEEFVIGDLRVGDQRHLVMATPFQLRLLNQTRRWFIDGTFKVVKDPFKANGQLMSVHGFVQQDGVKKQFPMAFVLMSRKKKEDYIAVLRCLKEKLPSPVVQAFVLDFEKGAWQAVREVFPLASIKGCVFHWVQAVWRNVQHRGLQQTYRENEAVHRYIRQLMALPFLPAAQTTEAFYSLKPRARLPELASLVDYIDRQWFRNPVFPVDDWSVFRQTVRTNNDVEGWHHRMNVKAGQAGLGIYRRLPLLRREAQLVDLNVAAGDLERDTSTMTTQLERRLQDAWDRYMEGEVSTSKFLRTVAHLYGPKDD